MSLAVIAFGLSFGLNDITFDIELAAARKKMTKDVKVAATGQIKIINFEQELAKHKNISSVQANQHITLTPLPKSEETNLTSSPSAVSNNRGLKIKRHDYSAVNTAKLALISFCVFAIFFLQASISY